MSRANPSEPARDSPPVEALTTPGSDVGRVFSRAVGAIQAAMAPGDAVVDVEITFRAVTIDSRGIPLFTSRSEQSTMEMRLATRIRAPEPDRAG